MFNSCLRKSADHFVLCMPTLHTVNEAYINNEKNHLIKSFLKQSSQLGEGVDGEGEGDSKLQHKCLSVAFQYPLIIFPLKIYDR